MNGGHSMALVDLWNTERSQIIEKRIDQLIAFAGEGRLRDGNDTSHELRELLAVLPSDLIGEWIEGCLTNRFTDFGFVLQDIINEIGRRLGFRVTPGVYRGHGNESYDGLWLMPDGRAVLIESKSSTAYSINLTRIAGYRKQIAPEIERDAEEVSILLVVGTEETEELEAQVRGSRFAWSVRLLGVHALFRLLQLKETLDDPNVERQIQEILMPQEFTRLDRIVDLVFATAEDASSAAEEEEEDFVKETEATTVRSSFHSEILPRLERYFGKALVKRSRVLWAPPDNQVLVSCQVSKEYRRAAVHYWFGLKRTTKETLEAHENAYCAFGLSSPEKVVLLKFADLAPHLDGLFTSPAKDGGILHWHIRFSEDQEGIFLLLNRDQDRFPVTEHLLEG
jgi:hypothetical protein